MAMMNAAVVTSFDEPPHYQPFDVPQPAGDGEILVDVLAVGLHPRVRTGAAGAHYTSRGTLPMIPGVDGVGRRQDGTRIYFAAGRRRHRHDGRPGRRRRAARGRAARRHRRRQGRRRDEPGHVVVGGAAAPRTDRARPERPGARRDRERRRDGGPDRPTARRRTRGRRRTRSRAARRADRARRRRGRPADRRPGRHGPGARRGRGRGRHRHRLRSGASRPSAPSWRSWSRGRIAAAR